MNYLALRIQRSHSEGQVADFVKNGGERKMRVLLTFVTYEVNHPSYQQIGLDISVNLLYSQRGNGC